MPKAGGPSLPLQGIRGDGDTGLLRYPPFSRLERRLAAYRAELETLSMNEQILRTKTNGKS